MLYLDVLVLLNAGIGAVFLLAAGKLARRKTSRWRLTLSALAAGGYSLVLLLALPGWLLLLLQLPVSLGLVLLCYGWGGKWETLRLLLCFWGGNLLLGAVLGILDQWLAPLGALSRGGIYYVPVEPVVLVLVTIGCYLVLWLVGKFRKKPANRLRFRLKAGQREVEFTALVDTGNRLQDPITGRSVLVVQQKVLQNCLPSAVLDALSQGRPEQIQSPDWQRRCGVLPIRTAGGTGLLGTFRPEGLWLLKEGKTERVGALVAVTPQPLGGREYQALAGEQL